MNVDCELAAFFFYLSKDWNESAEISGSCWDVWECLSVRQRFYCILEIRALDLTKHEILSTYFGEDGKKNNKYQHFLWQIIKQNKHMRCIMLCLSFSIDCTNYAVLRAGRCGINSWTTGKAELHYLRNDGWRWLNSWRSNLASDVTGYCFSSPSKLKGIVWHFKGCDYMKNTPSALLQRVEMRRVIALSCLYSIA